MWLIKFTSFILQSPTENVDFHFSKDISVQKSIYQKSMSQIKFRFFLQVYLTQYIYEIASDINPLEPELFFLILAHPVYKTRIIQEPNKLAL